MEEEEQESYNNLENERDKLYHLITKDWKSGDLRFQYLAQIIDIEIELEGFCNQ